ncbi:MAG: hypothetical protein ABW009_02225 [Acidimicrobiales bacterium]
MLDVHEQQVLVLLLMVQAQLGEVGDAGRDLTGEPLGHRLVHGLAVVADLGRTGAGEQAPVGGGGAACRPPRSTS